MPYINIRTEIINNDMIMLGEINESHKYVVLKYVGGHMLVDRYDTNDFEFANNYFESLMQE